MYHSKHQIQNIEQRSIALYDVNQGPHSLPVNIDRSVFKKTASEREEVKQVQSNFKRNGLAEWKERNKRS